MEEEALQYSLFPDVFFSPETVRDTIPLLIDVKHSCVNGVKILVEWELAHIYVD